MGISDFFKKETSNEVWRDSNGNICPQNNCKKECDDTCPIWCKNYADSLFATGRRQAAILFYRKTLSIAPDFKEVWINMAAAYSETNNHMEACNSYRIAYSIDPKSRESLFGLIMSSKHLALYEKALSYCDEYEILVGKDEADKLREGIKLANQIN